MIFKKILITAFVFMLILANLFSNKNLTRIHTNLFIQINEQPVIIPTPLSLKRITAGFEAIASDIYWIKAIQYTGAHAHDESFNYLGEYIELITSINKRFKYAYEFASLVVPTKNPELAEKLTEKGLNEFPDFYRLYLNQAFIQYFHLNNSGAAVQTLSKIEDKENIPKSIKRLKGAILSNADQHEAALQFYLSQKSTDYIQSRIIREQGFIYLNNAIKKNLEIKKMPPSGSSNLKFIILNNKPVLKDINFYQ